MAVLLLVTESNPTPWVFFTFFKLYKLYQIAPSLSYAWWDMDT